MNTNKHEFSGKKEQLSTSAALSKQVGKVFHSKKKPLPIIKHQMTTEPKTYSALGADLTHAAEAISRARIAVFKASDPDELRHAVRRSEDAEETLTQILSRRGVIRCIFRASIDAIADIRAFADIRRGDCAIYTATGNNGDIEIRYIIPFSFGSPAAREQAENKLREALRARGYEVVNAAADGRDWTADLRAARKD